MHSILRTITLAAALCLAAPLALRAESAPADSAPAAAMPCPHAEGGACCGTCQEQQQQAAAGAPAAAPAEAGGCPCQRAKQEAARKAAEAQQSQ
ncbi:MAG: hypothetical protein ABI629_00780 [bacterium]